MTSEPQVVDLSAVERIKGLEFRFAEVWRDSPTLAIVIIRGSGRPDIRLRMDLFKRSFIDHVDDDETDRTIRTRAAAVWETITQAKPKLM